MQNWMTKYCKQVWFGPLMGCVSYLLLSGQMSNEMLWTLGITIWVALWWVFEVVPIPIASMVPFVMFPISGVLSNKEVAQAYGHWLILLLMGGFMLSTMIERSGLHKRVAIRIMEFIGVDSPKRLLFGVMLSTAVMSAWISNTATTLIVLPIVLAIGSMMNNDKALTILLLGLAYGASIGGMTTPIGTPPNIVLIGVLEETTGETIPFLSWMAFAVPIAIVLLFGAWWVLSRELNSAIETVKVPRLSSMTTHEYRVLCVFGLVVLLWITRVQPFGGWSTGLDITTTGDDTVALFGVVLAFLVPTGSRLPATKEYLLDWESARSIPWGLLLLFGGGIAIAKAFKASGLSTEIGTHLVSLQDFPLIWMIAGLCLGVTFLTEVTSNTATTTLLMPILVAAGLASGMDPKLWMIPAALSASCAFMLPVATAPNAIVFGSGKVSASQMSKMGLKVNLLGVIVITLGVLLLL